MNNFKRNFKDRGRTKSHYDKKGDKSSPKERIIGGRNPIRELLKRAPERILRVYLSRAFEKKNPLSDDILSTLGVISKDLISYEDTSKLDQIAGFASHQGVVAVVNDTSGPSFKELLEGLKDYSNALLLAVDSVEDPHNLGTILRAAECFGVNGVILPKNRGTTITSTVAKTSVGASELVTVSFVSNLASAIELAKEAGFWVVSADCSKDAISMNKMDFPAKTLIVVGSEGDGIQDLILKRSDFRVFIPLYGQIDSLNVSQATAIFLSSYRSRWT